MADRGANAVRRQGKFGDGGFTLIESLTAATILLIIAVAVITTLVTTAGWYSKARMRTEANAVANEIMTNIMSRNASDIQRPKLEGQTWPEYIPERMDDWSTPAGMFTIETSLSPWASSSIDVTMTQVIVTAYPKGQPLDPAVTIIRYASGWQDKSAPRKDGYAHVTVTVDMADKTPGRDYAAGATNDKSDLSGARVQLLAAVDSTSSALKMGNEAYFAVTGSDGVADFGMIRTGKYFVTCDPRFGSDIRPEHFPMLIYPTGGGSAGAAADDVLSYHLAVVESGSKAILRVGAFLNAGYTKISAYEWKSPQSPYQLSNVYVCAQPLLNTGTKSRTLGYESVYPDESSLVYKAKVNAFGIAPISVGWTIDADEGQKWTVWVEDADGNVIADPKDDIAQGSWTTDLTVPDLLTDYDYGTLPQFQRVTQP